MRQSGCMEETGRKGRRCMRGARLQRKGKGGHCATLRSRLWMEGEDYMGVCISAVRGKGEGRVKGTM